VSPRRPLDFRVETLEGGGRFPDQLVSRLGPPLSFDGALDRSVPDRPDRMGCRQHTQDGGYRLAPPIGEKAGPATPTRWVAPRCVGDRTAPNLLWVSGIVAPLMLLPIGPKGRYWWTPAPLAASDTARDDGDRQVENQPRRRPSGTA
jgi:hypothetical protein